MIRGINGLQIYDHHKQEPYIYKHLIENLFDLWIDMIRIWHQIFWCLFHEVLIRMAKYFQTSAPKVNILNIIH